MANIYARETSLKNVVGRSDYISNPKRQEEIVLHKKNMKHTWKEYADFEKSNQKSKNANIQARETVVALPNELSNDSEKLERFCDLLAKKMYGENRDYEYAVHWNSSRTNLHVHFIYSEREVNLESKPKIYKRDLWADKVTGKVCKKDNPNAILRAKKGEVMKDKDGNVRYETDQFSSKDKKYNNKSWLKERNLLIKDVFRAFDYEIDIFDRETQIARKKLYKGAKNDYLEFAKKWNEKAGQITQNRAEAIPFEREVKKVEPAVKELKKLSKGYKSAKNRLGKERNLLDKVAYNLSQKSIDENIVSEFKAKSKEIVKMSKPPFAKGYRASSVLQYFRDLLDEIQRIKDRFLSERNLLKKDFGTIDKYQKYKLSIESEKKSVVSIDLIKEINKKALEQSQRKTENIKQDLER